MTSGSINFTENRNEIIIDAFSKIRVFAIGETPTTDDVNLASRALNRMVKEWQAKGWHLWKKREATLFLAKGVHEYLLGGTSSDHVTEEYVKTTLTADAASGTDTLTVTSSAGMTAADYIGIVLDDSSLFWTTIKAVLGATSVQTDAVLTGKASKNKYVFAYTTKITRPLLIPNARRYTVITGQEIPLISYSHSQYYDMPTKESQGSPNIFNYDPQLDSGKLNIWPTPADINYLINFTYAKSIEDFDNITDNPDFPQEWLDALVYNLALNLGPDYGKANNPDFSLIVQRAKESLDVLQGFDSERGSIFFQPDNRP